jgi:predicted dehydrogenase
MLRVGVIGVGSMGKNHVRVYSGLPDVELVGIADTSESLVGQTAEMYHIKPFVDYKKLLEEELDAVSICVPTSLHKKVAVDTADAGVNVLVEKPIADTVGNAKKIIEACKKNDVKLMVGHIERFNPVISVIKKSLEKNDIISISISRVGPFPPRIKDVGVVVDLAIHDIDLVRYITNSEFKKIFKLTSKSITKYEDTAILMFEMENGTLAQITTNWLTPFKIREINIATREKFVMGKFIEQKVTEYSLYKRDGSYISKELTVPFGEPLKLELESFVKSIKNSTTPAITGYDGLRALEVATKCGTR